MDGETRPSQSAQVAGSKRKRGAELKLYVVRTGHKPGIYHSWNDCLEQVKGYKGADFKSFLTLTEAENFFSNGTPARQTTKGPQKYYGVQNGRVPGVYTDWQSASAQITGWTKPKHRAFLTHAEAEAFVKEGVGNTGMGEAVPGVSVDSNGSSKPPPKKQKKKTGNEDGETAVILDGDYEAGEGPLPAGAVDQFDPSITLDPATGKAVYKTDKQLNATKWQATGPADDGMLRIYTDGSSLGNGQNGAVAGVGVYFGPNDKRNISESLTGPRQTNQRAELTAILRALELSPRDRPVTIYSDSSYAINCVTTWFQKWRSNGWVNSSKKPVENKDLIEKVLGMLEERERIGRQHAKDNHLAAEEGEQQSGWNKGRARVQFVWVKGHKDDPGNIAADGLAVEGAREAKRSAAQ